jgi:hypothetical protein
MSIVNARLSVLIEALRDRTLSDTPGEDDDAADPQAAAKLCMTPQPDTDEAIAGCIELDAGSASTLQ